MKARVNALGRRRSSSFFLLLSGGGRGASVPRIQLSGQSIAETGGVVGTLSTANTPDDWGDSVYSIPEGGDPDGKFTLDGNEVSASDLDAETDQSHPLTILDTPTGPYDPIQRTFNIGVTNVLEVTLNALSLDADEIDEGDPEDTVVGAVVGKSSGSTLSLIGNAGGKYKLSGTNIVAGATPTTAGTDEITLRETHADGSNSPRDTVIAITVLEEGGEEATGLLVALGDSVTYDEGGSDPSYATQGAALCDPLLNFDNEGINGTGAQDWIDEIATTLALFDAVPDSEPKIITVNLGNTISIEGGSAGAITKAIELFDLIRRSDNNIKVIYVGELDRSDAGFRTARTTIASWAETNLGLYLDAFIDMKNDVPDGMAADGAADNETWYPTDGIHPGPLVHDAAAPVYAAGVDALVAAFLADTSAPTIVRLTPADGATTVQVEEFPFIARFNKQVKFTADVSISLYNGSDVLVEEFTEADIGSSIAIHGVDLEITPSAPLADDDDYYIQISSGSITDVLDNAFAGISDTTTWRFTVPLDVDLTLDLKAYWELEEASGTREDSHGSNDLTDNNTVTQTTGKVGNCAVFTAANSESLSVADNDDLGYSGDFSWAGWVYFTTITGGRFAAKGANSFAQNEFSVFTQFVSANNIRFECFTSGGGSTNVTNSQALSTSTWYFVVATYTASTRGMTVSVNANTRATATLSSAMARKSQPFSLGAFGSSYHNGRLDQVGFWKRVLTVEEEAWLYNLGNGRTYAEIAATGA